MRRIAVLGFCSIGNTFEAAPQACLESIDRLSGVRSLNLSSDRTAVDVDVRLSDHRARHRRIGMPAHPDPGVQHRLMREPAEPADLLPHIVLDTWWLTLGRHIDVESYR